MAKTVTIKIEGTSLEMNESDVDTDKKLKDALAPYYPAAANATVERKTKDGATIITVTKKAGGKGWHDCPECQGACYCDQEDHYSESAPRGCAHDCDGDSDDEDDFDV